MQRRLISFPHGEQGPDGDPLMHAVLNNAGGLLETACGRHAVESAVTDHGDSDDLAGETWYMCGNCNRVLNSKEDA